MFLIVRVNCMRVRIIMMTVHVDQGSKLDGKVDACYWTCKLRVRMDVIHDVIHESANCTDLLDLPLACLLCG